PLVTALITPRARLVSETTSPREAPEPILAPSCPTRQPRLTQSRVREDAMTDQTHGSDLFEIIRTTRSMRRLRPDPVPNELLRKILEAGVCAPSGGNMQRWRFLVVRDAGINRRSGLSINAPGSSRLPHGIDRVNRPLARAASGLRGCSP